MRRDNIPNENVRPAELDQFQCPEEKMHGNVIHRDGGGDCGQGLPPASVSLSFICFLHCS